MKVWKIARILGIDIEIHFTLLFVFALVLWSLSAGFFPVAVPGQSALFYWLSGLFTTLIFFASIIFHELSHSIVAQKFGIGIERITLFILGGVAQLKGETKNPQAEFLMALAGPLGSLVLAGTFWVVCQVGLDVFPVLILVALSWLALNNLMLALFNLLPGFPMDGGRIFRAFLWWRWKDELKATRVSTIVGKAFGILMIIGGGLLIFLMGDISGLWLSFIGWFLFDAAGASYQEIVFGKILASTKAGDTIEKGTILFMPENADSAVICSSEDSLEVVVKRMRESQQTEFYVASQDNKIIGRITFSAILQHLQSKSKKA